MRLLLFVEQLTNLSEAGSQRECWQLKLAISRCVPRMSNGQLGPKQAGFL